MATIREYFEADFSHTVIMSTALRLPVQAVGDVELYSQIHLDFLPIRSINFPYSELQAAGRAEYPTPAVAG